MPFTNFRIATVDIIVVVKNNSLMKMDEFFKRKRDINECNLESEQLSSAKSCSSKKVKSRAACKYSYLNFGFSWTENVDNSLPVCLVCRIKKSNESMLPSKLNKHFKSKHSHLQD